MARAYSIWVVSSRYAGVIATFTVKHEMEAWVREHNTEYSKLSVARFLDGGGGFQEWVEVHE